MKLALDQRPWLTAGDFVWGLGVPAVLAAVGLFFHFGGTRRSV